jgi:predicted small lipoprotein YifL
MTMRMTIRAGFALAVVFSLAACGSRSEEPLPETPENIVTDVPVDTVLPANASDAALDPPAPPTNVVTPAAPPPAFSDTEQMRDDADATGLTSRIARDDAAQPTANETAPVAE